ncbi:MAG: glycosyltransferase [Sphingomonadales bacterium]|nr:MAG: glycosyltransferase [Sphingomonadales bacterium]
MDRDEPRSRACLGAGKKTGARLGRCYHALASRMGRPIIGGGAQSELQRRLAQAPRLVLPRAGSDGDGPVKIAICVIAKNEEGTISALVSQLARQTLLSQPYRFQILVVANACSDATAAVARAALLRAFADRPADILVHETPIGGKARSWNLAVHELVAEDAEIILFLDSDIEFIDDLVLERLIGTLRADAALLAVSGHPVKNILKKRRKTLIDRFSLIISRHALTPHAINGSLYAARMEPLRKTWLPVPTPGEDGLLTAMIHTDGFSRPALHSVITQIARPTHYFEAHSVSGFFRHERRMTVGTVINGWICEFMWAANYKENAGPFIRDRNEKDPEWIGRLIESRVAGRRWALPPRMLTWRLHSLRGIGVMRAVERAPFSLAATLLGIWPAIQANRTLRRKDSAHFW